MAVCVEVRQLRGGYPCRLPARSTILCITFFCLRSCLVFFRTLFHTRKVIVFPVRLPSSPSLFSAAFGHVQGYFPQHYGLLHDGSRTQDMSIPPHAGPGDSLHCIHIRRNCRSALYSAAGPLQISSHVLQLFCCRAEETATRKHRLSLLPDGGCEGGSSLSDPQHTLYHAFQAGTCSGCSGP